MRDDKDPGTQEIQGLGRRGRPPADGIAAKSGADRAREFRQRRKELRSKLERKRGGWRDASDAILVEMIQRAMSVPSEKSRAKLIAIYAAELAERYPRDPIRSA
ncbi:hypothetical protein ISN36_07850 [Xanthomonas translucens pv. undulosa]|uniref:hypothetical protein n=1 Tax=Xanthomonas campestris pv. translucens TaxID=343 RepID=UPI0019D6D31C|nr:hypothetical protein [Xanthomonas translucens]QSQ54085.1 hypothetical protein ISN36_07850 [Xanthomonas translucens pv. undulosa]QSQ60294.1 hypothetical protein ISN38_00385 [Xanthomonas translucens pv. undulosa]